VCCAKQDAQKGALLAFGVAALINVAPADAGVILEKPQIRKVLQDDTPAAPAPKREIILPGQRSKAAPAAASATKAAPAPRVAETSGGDLDPRAVALPGTLALIAGGAFALSKIDDGFTDFMRETSCKDSNDYAGYEPALKEGGVLAMKSKGNTRAGTKKVKAASKSGTTSSNPLDSLFGKN
jgi:hypothetical protein